MLPCIDLDPPEFNLSTASIWPTFARDSEAIPNFDLIDLCS